MDAPNRDDVKPSFPLQDDLRLNSSYISNAHEIIRKGLQQFLQLKETDLETYLSHIIKSDTITFEDEYGVVIHSYYKVFQFIWVQYNETLCQNYATKQYDLDKLDMCSVARFLSHQAAVKDRSTLMKRMGDALEYKCHPCTPYKRKEYGRTDAPNAEDINLEALSPEDILNLCKTSTAPSATTTIRSTSTSAGILVKEQQNLKIEKI